MGAGHEREDWADGSRGLLDAAVVLAGALLVVVGLWMSVQDYGHELRSASALRAYGSTLPFDVSHRRAYAGLLLAVTSLVSLAAAWRAWRVGRSRRLSRHARRPLALLVLGSALADGAYALDAVLFRFGAPHALRAFAIDPAYAIAGVIVAGAAWRIRTLIRPLPPGDPEIEA